MTFDEILSHPLVLTVLFVSVLVGFLISVLILHIFDSRVFDLKGRYIPSPLNHLWGVNYYSILAKAKRSKQFSQALSSKFLVEIGDGNIAGYNSIFGTQTIVIAHPDMVKAVLAGHPLKFPKTKECNRLRFFLGDGLFTSSGSKWQSHRNMIGPGFHPELIKSMVKVFQTQAEKLRRHLQHNIRRASARALDSQTAFEGVQVNLSNDLTNLAMSIICSVAFGFDFQSSANREYVAADFETIIDELNSRATEDPGWGLLFQPTRRRSLQSALHAFGTLVDDAITERIDFYARQQKKFPRNYSSQSDLSMHPATGLPEPAERHVDMLDILLRSSQGMGAEAQMSRTELRDHVFTFVAAGHETVSSTLLWLVYELCEHPEVQWKCQKEVDAVMSVNGLYKEEIGLQEINRFSYLLQVVKETMRLHPVVGTLARRCQVDSKIGDFHIRAGSSVLISVNAVHRHPDFWYQADEFYPERFSPQFIRETIKHQYQHIPFSAGPRNCIGQRLAQMEVVVVAVTLLSAFQFSLSGEQRRAMRSEEASTVGLKNFRVTVSLRDKP